MNKYNIWDKWGKLNSVLLGTTYQKEFYRGIKNKKIRDAFYRIADESHEDLENYAQVLKDFGCEVIRPELDPNDELMNYIDADGKIQTRKGLIVDKQQVPRAPLQPRDCTIVIGNTQFRPSEEHQSVYDALDKWNSQDVVTTWSRNIPQVSAPEITQIGKDIYIDEKFPEMAAHLEQFRQHYPNLRYNRLKVGGHNDACFSAIKPGAIMSLREIQKYEKTFPGWDVCYLEGESWRKVYKFQDLKDKNEGKWWIPGEEDNDELTYFVETWLNDWVGYVEETVFDVNTLVLDEHHICVANPNNEIVNSFLKKHKMEPVHVPWRHRYFWDGGLHCLTLDLNRDGGPTDYFPDRDGPVSCEGFD